MAWRFKASKFKNAAPIVPKPEACIRDICVGSYQTYGNNIAASAAFMAFNVDHNGSCLAVLPIDDCGRKSKTMPLLYAHTDTVTDMDFSPFHDGLLATGSQDCMVKVWHIPEKGLEENMTEADCTFSHKQRRVETVGFHPTADCLLHSTSYTTLTLWDLTAQAELYSNSEHGDVVQSVSWRRDGRILATSSKDKTLRVVDPRGARAVTHSAASHQSIKDSRVVWIGDSNRVLTTGFDSARQREVFIRDLRNFSQPEKTLVLDSSTGILIPLYDADTGMLFLAGKGDTTIAYLEVIEREPYLVEGIRHSGEQTKGACLVPKRTLNVMQAEVNRVLQLTSTTVIPIMYQVPRKSYRDFHADLFPETAAPESQLTAAAWMKGSDTQLNRLSLDPSQKQLIQVHRGSLSEMRQQLQESQKTQPKTIEAPKTYRNNIAAARNMFEKDKNENNEQRNKQTEIVKKTEDVQNDNDDDEKIIENGNKADVTPPKPLPRRANSLSESEEVVTQQKPVARPRTNSVAPTGPLVPPTTTASSPASAYKPRLGPKPFSPRAESESGASELDRVFSVPAAPSSPAATNGSQSHGHSPPDSPPAHTHTPNQEEGTNGEVEVSSGRGNVTPEVESGSSEADRDGEGERADGVGDAERGGGLERGGVRGSIAERRRLYENRSLSVQEPVTPSPTALRRRDSLKQSKSGSLKEEDGANGKRNSTVQAPKRTSTVFGRVSKFRHLKGTPAHKSAHIENIRNISRQISGECDGFHANSERVAVPLSGPGGKIAVFELSKTGKLADGVIPTLVHGTNVMDFAWDPFNERRLAVACDDGTIRLWLVPEGGLPEPTNAPDAVLEAHTEKIYSIKFHPLAQDVLASGSYDMTVRVWDLTRGHDPITLLGHTDQMFSLAWSSCGCLLATVCKDGVLRVYEPRRSPYPLAQGKGPVGTRGARVVWALDSAFIVVTGFDKVSERQIIVYERDDLSSPLATVGLDVSPAILIPFYDEDSSTLFLTGKGDSTIYAFEVCGEPPYVCALSHHRCASLHQGLSFLPKRACDVSIVEFAKAYRLTNTTIEPLSFTVPRIKSDLFQDDLFPMTRVTWEPTLSADQWFSSTDRIPQRVSLKPDHMDNLSEAQGAAGVSPSSASGGGGGKSGGGGGGGAETRPPPTTTTRLGWAPDHQAATKQKEQQLQQSVSSRVELNLKLEQDQMEGVDDREWICHWQRMKQNLMLMENSAADHSDGETNGGLPEFASGTTRTLTSWLKSIVTPTSVRFKTEKISDAPPKIGVVPVESAANRKACLKQSKISSNLNKSPEVRMTIERDGAPQTVGVAVQTDKIPLCEIKDSNSQTEDLIWLYNRRVHFFGSIHTHFPLASTQ